MKAPSTDMMIKLAIGGAAVLAVVVVYQTLTKGLKSAIETGSAVVSAVNPLNNDNVIYHTVNRATGGDKDRPLGVRIYNFFHPGE